MFFCANNELDTLNFKLIYSQCSFVQLILDGPDETSCPNDLWTFCFNNLIKIIIKKLVLEVKANTSSQCHIYSDMIWFGDVKFIHHVSVIHTQTYLIWGHKIYKSNKKFIVNCCEIWKFVPKFRVIENSLAIQKHFSFF